MAQSERSGAFHAAVGEQAALGSSGGAGVVRDGPVNLRRARTVSEAALRGGQVRDRTADTTIFRDEV
jgi:hypothetical protein